MAYMHPQHFDRPISPAYLSPVASPQAVQFAGIPSATFYAPNIRTYSPQPAQAPSPAPPSAFDRSPNGPFALSLDEDPALTLSRMRDAVAQIQGMVESVAARAASPLPFRASTPQQQPQANQREPEPLTQSISDTTISSIATITPAPRKAAPAPLTLTLTPSSPDPPRPATINPGPPRRSNTEPTMPRERTRNSNDGGRPSGGEVLFQRAISPLAQQRNSMDSQRSASGRGTPLMSPGMRSASATSVTRSTAASPDGVVLTEAERRMPWRERIALRREARQAAERAELGVRPPSANTDARRQHHTHSRNASGQSEYYSVRARSPSLTTPIEDLRVEDLRPQSRATEEAEADGDADAEESRVMEEREQAAVRTADWLGAGPGRRALRAAGLLDEIQEKKESYPPTSGTRTARRGRRTPSSASHSSATHRHVSGSDTPSLSIPARSFSATPSLIVDSQTPTTTTTPSTFSEVSSPPGLAQVLELHNLEKGALLGALQESKRREREREEETRKLNAELELLRARIRELETALVHAHQQQSQGPKKSRLPVSKPRVPSNSSSVDRPMMFPPQRSTVRRSESASTLGASHQVPISPPSSGRSRSISDSPTRVHRPFPMEHARPVSSTPTKHAGVEECYIDSGSESGSLRLKTEDERHLQEFVDVTLGAPSDDESFY
ncbi:hypothetical protein CALCODRAFT_482566 [Calocera cornea HHB12733]|uniref:Uncharacterized protein n=1 Tax=Calocera cornea HHB12733 TaxID=1353952 RepID=A0A165GK83_9BASI|nr:hypothetical protein CALCODRAFT_482566 [Calocera cornea HHB12733]